MSEELEMTENNEEKVESNKKNLNAIIVIVIIVLLGLTVGAACFFLRDREEVPEHSLVLVSGGKESTVDIDKLELTHFSGTTVNGKGEEKSIDADGIKLSDVIDVSNYTEASVVADDSYSATVKKEEMDQAWLEIEEGSARLIVLGDTDSKRNVKNVVRIEVK